MSRYLWAKLSMASDAVAKGLGFGLGVAVILEVFDLRLVAIVLQAGASQ